MNVLKNLFDEGTFVELDQFVKHRCTNFGQEKKDLPAEGVITGYGTVDGRLVYAYASRLSLLKVVLLVKCMLKKKSGKYKKCP